jgi:threonine/homoserine/homoserine lactone efflux protein
MPSWQRRRRGRTNLLILRLRIAGTLYFLFLAWSLIRTWRDTHTPKDRNLDFWAGALFQAVDPKAWFMCITAISLFLAPGWSAAALALMIATLTLIAVLANMARAGLGQVLRPLVSNAARMRAFNAVMAVLLVLSILPVWLPNR